MISIRCGLSSDRVTRLTRGGQIYKMDDRFLELFDEKERPCKSLRLGCISFFFFIWEPSIKISEEKKRGVPNVK